MGPFVGGRIFVAKGWAITTLLRGLFNEITAIPMMYFTGGRSKSEQMQFYNKAEQSSNPARKTNEVSKQSAFPYKMQAEIWTATLLEKVSSQDVDRCRASSLYATL